MQQVYNGQGKPFKKWFITDNIGFYITHSEYLKGKMVKIAVSLNMSTIIYTEVN